MRIRLELKAPARPRSAVITSSRIRFSGRAGQQRDLFVGVLLGRGLRHIRQHALDDLGVRTRGDHAILRAAQLRRRDHLHGLGDLLRVLHRADAPADVDQAGHGLSRDEGFFVLGNEAVLEFLQHRVQLGLQLVVQRLLLADLLAAMPDARFREI